MKYIVPIGLILVLMVVAYLASTYAPTPKQATNKVNLGLESNLVTDANNTTESDDAINRLFYANTGEYKTYTNTKYGFSFEYNLRERQVFGCNDNPRDLSTETFFVCGVGVPDTDIPGGLGFYLMKSKSLNDAVQRNREMFAAEKLATGEGYTEANKVINGIEVVILRGYQEFADAYVEIHLGMLASGYVFEMKSDGPFKTEPNLRFLNSLRNL